MGGGLFTVGHLRRAGRQGAGTPRRSAVRAAALHVVLVLALFIAVPTASSRTEVGVQALGAVERTDDRAAAHDPPAVSEDRHDGRADSRPGGTGAPPVGAGDLHGSEHGDDGSFHHHHHSDMDPGVLPVVVPLAQGQAEPSRLQVATSLAAQPSDGGGRPD